MDHNRFDAFTRSLVTAASRRRVVVGALTGVAGAILPSFLGIGITPAAAACSTIHCDVDCPKTVWACIAGKCVCGSGPRHHDGSAVAFIKSDRDGAIVGAASLDTAGNGELVAEMNVERDCVQGRCVSTIIARGASSQLLSITATAVAPAAGSAALPSQRLDVVGSGSSYSIVVETGDAFGTITSAIDDKPPVAGTVELASGTIVGDWICTDAPVAFPKELTSLEPAFQAISGASFLDNARRSCPPGAPGPTRPLSASAPPVVMACHGACAAVGVATGEICCIETAGIGCAACLAGAAELTEMCHRACADSTNSDGISGVGGVSGPGTPPPATAVSNQPTRTPTEARECAAGELPCADRCIPATECPVATCCLSPESCGCVCPDCGDHGAFDPNTCRCACNADALPCAEGCMSVAACPPASCCLSAETCLCTCPDCGPNGEFDPTTCGCTCGPIECPPHLVLDDVSCSCVCAMSECAPNHEWDLAACTCTCVPQECPATQVFDESLCACVCGLGGCPPNYFFDQASCACVCAAECPPGYVVDQASCTCSCVEVGCPEGQVFDPTSCACVGSGAAGAVEGSA